MFDRRYPKRRTRRTRRKTRFRTTGGHLVHADIPPSPQFHLRFYRHFPFHRRRRCCTHQSWRRVPRTAHSAETRYRPIRRHPRAPRTPGLQSQHKGCEEFDSRGMVTNSATWKLTPDPQDIDEDLDPLRERNSEGCIEADDTPRRRGSKLLMRNHATHERSYKARDSQSGRLLLLVVLGPAETTQGSSMVHLVFPRVCLVFMRFSTEPSDVVISRSRASFTGMGGGISRTN